MTQANPIPVIAIDGPSSSGKGTVAAALAEKLGFHYLDSGALYRLTALSVLKAGVNPDDESACETVARAMKPVFKEGRIFLEGEDVTQAIRAEEVGLTASRVAALPAVRQLTFGVQFIRPPTVRPPFCPLSKNRRDYATSASFSGHLNSSFTKMEAMATGATNFNRKI